MRDSYLYILQCESFYKVGISYGTDVRIETMSTGNPFEIKLLHSICFEHRADCKTAEKLAHTELIERGLHHKLEWFKGTIDEILEVCSEASRIASHVNRIRNDQKRLIALHLIDIAKQGLVSSVAGISEQRIADIVKNKRMTNLELAKINSLIIPSSLSDYLEGKSNG